MPSYPYDLSKDYSPTAAPSVSPEPSEKCYPNLYLDGVGDLGLPEDGVMTIRFHRRYETTTSNDKETTQCVCLDVQEILSVKADKAGSSDNPGDRLDALRKEIESMQEDLAEGGQEEGE